MFWKRKKKVEVSETALRLDGKLLTLVARRYMDENGSPQEEGLGRGGRIDTANGHVILSTDKGEVFVNSDIASVECGELMSKGGALFSGYNELNGQEETIVCYYTRRQ
jgi:hypothetical protein